MSTLNTAPQTTLVQAPVRPHASAPTAALRPTVTANTSTNPDLEPRQGPAVMSDLVAALHANETHEADLQRRAEQAALQARQRFD